MEDQRNLTFNLLKAGIIDKESALDLLDVPMKQLLKERLKKMEEKQQTQKTETSKKEEPKTKELKVA